MFVETEAFVFSYEQRVFQSKMRQYSKTELDSSPSPTRSTGAESGGDMDEPSAKKAKTGEKKDKDTRREELLKQLRSVEEAIAKKRSSLTWPKVFHFGLTASSMQLYRTQQKL